MRYKRPRLSPCRYVGLIALILYEMMSVVDGTMLPPPEPRYRPPPMMARQRVISIRVTLI